MQVFPVNLENDDYCTIISIVPFPIHEFKPGIYPGNFNIDACLDPSKPNALAIGTSVHFIPQYNGDEEMPSHVVKTHCREIANAVINDYLQGQMDVDEDTKPGLIFTNGKITGEMFALAQPGVLGEMKKKQFSWFAKLVQRADNDWNRYKRHTVVSDNQRFAARALGMQKEWLSPLNTEIPVKCPACLMNCDPRAIVCSNCRCILDEERYKKLSFAA